MSDTKMEECKTSSDDGKVSGLADFINEQVYVCILTMHQESSRVKLKNLQDQLCRVGVHFAHAFYGVDGVKIREDILRNGFVSSKTEPCNKEAPEGWPESWSWPNVCGYMKGYSSFTPQSNDINTKVSTMAVLKSKLEMLLRAVQEAKKLGKKYILVLEDDAVFVTKFVENGYVLELLKALEKTKDWALAQLAPSHAANEGSFLYRRPGDHPHWLRTGRSTGGMAMMMKVSDTSYLECLQDSILGTVGTVRGVDLSGMIVPSDCSIGRLQEKGKVVVPLCGIFDSFHDAEGGTTSNTTGDVMDYTNALGPGFEHPHMKDKADSDACEAAYRKTLAAPSQPGSKREPVEGVSKRALKAWSQYVRSLQGMQSKEDMIKKMKEIAQS